MTPQRTPHDEVWMLVKNPKTISKLMVIQGVSQRKLAEMAGYKSHAYMGRILRGEVRTLDPNAAVRIAKFLGVGVDDLFLVRVSSDNGHNGHREGAA
jgi:transcriptional regulator with XRE-family HTH domain